MTPSRAIISGPEKAVLFLLSLDEHVAAPIVAQLSVGDLRKLREVASSMREVSSDALDDTYKEFVAQSEQAVALPRGGLHYLKQLAVSALGHRGASEVFDPTAMPTSPLRRLEHAQPDALASLLERESPQMIGAILSRVNPTFAAQILAALSPELQVQVLTFVAHMTDLPAGVLEDVARALTEELPASDAETLVSIQGVAKVAEILNAAGRKESGAILEKIDATEPELAREVRMTMFTMEDLRKLDKRSMRDLLREVPTDKLTLALKGASPELTAAIFGGLSERAAANIREDMELLARARKQDIDAARQEIVQLALRLEAEGTISLGEEEE
jgi:flagellar motor switch protein FliG